MSYLSSPTHMAFSPTLSPHHLSTKTHTNHHHLHFQIPQLQHHRRAPRRIFNYSQGGNLVTGPRNWGGGSIRRSYVVDDDAGTDDEGDDDEDDDRSLDLLVRFVQNVFRKVSRRARKAVRSVLPVSISTKLVGFSVNGVIILAFLWILKALLEVVCTLGSIVFVSILLIRGVWSGLSYLQENRNLEANVFHNNHSTWTGAQPVS
ncbi:hypothetical protein GIB67_020104 [Kingdonia uniflora]|uniref:Uncharacterized protein n=1 Tax=Kingdonia uniflora TaxID=39325 RepID=A0A7J7L2I5_9MAGN|nr:hypothetical protein GIB67_020104 [Kingdonia uniflora]